MIGRTISHYRIISELGAGGMGVVYRAEDVNLGRAVALKVLSPQLVSDPKARKRFLREAKAAAALDHAGICMVHEAEEAEGQFFIAMALLEGQTLRDRIASGPLSIDESLDIAAQVASALKEAHGKGIVHRDMKPGNIMLLPSGQAKVMDFGLARLEGATQLTRTGATIGTSAYMSPEQTRGEKVDERTDLWSLGVVLYEMISGRLPFRGEYEPAIEYAILHEEPEPLGTLRAGAPSELESLVSKCLEKNPAERYQSADELLRDLGRLQPLRKPGRADAEMPTIKPMPLSSTPTSQGQILGDRYRIERLLGRGGMGEVWQAFDLKIQIEVALKFLLPEVCSDPRRIELLRREVRSARDVASPHVCRIYDLIEIEGQELVSMEFVDGTTLDDMLESRSPLDIAEARRIASQLLAGLQAIHDADLIHRDLKPSNIMITRSGRTVVMDFGLAKGVAEKQSLAVAGTPAYMAPEQMRGEELDARADLHAAGMILAEMVAPGGVRDRGMRRKLWDGLRQDPPSAPPGPWEGAIRRAVAANRGERFTSAAELARSLGDVAMRLSGIEEVSPYPGLSSFTGAQARFFFGREIEVESIWRKLDRLSMAALIGPSGVGKSSFLRAGVIAAKPPGWSVAICTPGDAPFTSLGQSLVPDFAGQTEAMQELFRLQEIDRSIPLLNKWRLRSKEALLIVDQFEELFTLNPPEVQSRFAELLGRLSVEADIHVLVSMRDDFFFLCNQYPALRPLFAHATPLGALSPQDLRRAIVEPARLCGYAFEDDALVDEMMKEVEGERGALPLVAFAAARLWELRDREHGVIARRSYEEIGRVGGALAQHAETTLERIGHEREDIVREIFRNLVTAQHTRVVREREDLLSVFENRAKAEEVLKSLIDARLLTSFEIAEARDDSKECHRIEVVHESLLTNWPRLVRWQTQDTDGAQLRDQLRQAAQLWKEKRESDDLLWTGTAYQEFELWRERYPGGLTETEEAFGEAMGARARRDRRRRRIALGAVFAMLLAVIAVISWYGRAQQIARRESEAGKLIALGRAVLDKDPTVALAYATAALEIHDTQANRFAALEALSRGPMAFIMPTPVEFAMRAMRFDPEGKQLAAGGFDGIKVYRQDGSPPETLEDFNITWVSAPVFASDGDRVLWMDRVDHSIVHVWSLAAQKEVRTFKFEMRTDPLLKGFISRDNSNPRSAKFILRSWPLEDGEPRIISSWDSGDVEALFIDTTWQRALYLKNQRIYVCRPEELGTFRGRLVGEHVFKTSTLWFDRVGERIASADTSGEIRLWSLAGNSKEPLRVLHGEKPIRELEFDPSGTLLMALCGPEERICIWDLNGPWGADPAIYRIPKYDGFEDHDIDIDPSRRWVAAATLYGVAFMPLRCPDSYLLRGFFWSFAPDGQMLLLTDERQTLQLQNPEGGAARNLAKFETMIGTTALDPLGRFVAVGTNGAGVYLVSLKSGDVRLLPDSPPGGVYNAALAFGLDGKLLAGNRVGKEESGIRVWDIESDSVRVLGQAKKMSLWSAAFSADGSLITGDNEGNLLRWNVNDGSNALIEKSELRSIQQLEPMRDSRFVLGLFASGFGGNYRSQLKILDVEKGVLRSVSGRGDKVIGFALDSTRTILATSGEDGIVRVGPIEGGELHYLFAPWGKAGWGNISPDGKWIACSSTDFKEYCIWRAPTDRPLHTLRHEDLIAYLKAQTNLRIVRDKTSNTGYRVETAPFPGWEKLPPR